MADGSGGTEGKGLGHPEAKRSVGVQHSTSSRGQTFPGKLQTSARRALQPELRRGRRFVRVDAKLFR